MWCFCQQHGLHPFPASESVLIAYVAFLFQEKLSASTVGNYLAAVRFTQVALGLGDPRMGEMTRLEYVRKGFKRSTAGAPREQRLPITLGLLRQLKGVWSSWPTQRDAAMIWAAATICFFGFL